MELTLKCPYCKRSRKFIPRNKLDLTNKKLQCFFCGKTFKVKQGTGL